MPRPRAAALLAAGLAGVLLMSGCSGYQLPFGGSSSDSGANSGTGQAGGAGGTATAAGSGGAARRDTPPAGLIARQFGRLGTVVIDAKGWTLYRWDRDSAQPPVSRCTGPCAVKWPPELTSADGRVHVNGVDANLVGTLTRPDGTTQVTINGWPVYRYTGDRAVGDANGQAYLHLWYAVTPVGQRAGTANN